MLVNVTITAIWISPRMEKLSKGSAASSYG